MSKVFRQGVIMTQKDAVKLNQKKQDDRNKKLSFALKTNKGVSPVGGGLNALEKINELRSGEPLRFCLIRSLGGLGDALILTSVFKALKENYPDCHITYGTTEEYCDGVLFDILKNNPYIDNLVPYRQIRDKSQFHIYLDMTAVGVADEYRYSEPLDRQTLWAKHVGVPLGDGKCIYIVEEDERIQAKEWIIDHKKNKKSRFIFIQPGSFADRRNWPREKMVALIDRLHAYDKSLVFVVHDYNVDSHSDVWGAMPNTVNISDMGIREIAAIMEQCDTVIAHDSGMLHLAGALDKKIISIFGSTHPKSRINWFKNCIVVWQKKLACAPCFYKPCHNHFYCMKALDIDDVYNATLYMLEDWKKDSKNSGLEKLTNVDYFYGYKTTMSDGYNLNKNEIFPIRRITSKQKFKHKYELSILMVTMDNLKYLKNTVEDVFKYTEDFELIIYQNAAVDGSDVSKYLANLCKKNKNVKLIVDKKNTGFLEPNNTIAKKARGAYICLLNDDMTLCKNWSKIMIDELKSNDTLAQIGVSDTCTAIDNDGNGTHGNVTEYVEGSCMVMPRKIYDEYGLFDEKNLRFAYYEDSDLSLRLREQGWNIATINVPIIHHREKTSSIIKEDLKGYQTRNRAYFSNRWKSYLKNRTFNYQIAIQRSGAIGDVLLITPAIEAIKKKYPLSNITVITKCAEILVGNKYIHKCVKDSNKNKYDLFYNLDDSYENIQDVHILDAYAYSCGLNKEELGNISFTVENYKLDIDDDYVVIHTGPTLWAGRNWKQDRFDELAKKISILGYKIVLVGTNGTPGVTCDIDLRGKTSFAQTGSVIRHAKCFIGIDSSPFHIAQSQNTPSVVFFGCIDPKYRMINDNTISVSAKDLACIACHHWKQGDKRATATCIRNGSEQCIENVTVDMMYEKVLEALDE